MAAPEPAQYAESVATVQRYMTLDLWMALGLDPLDFDSYFDHFRFAGAWANLLAEVRRTPAQFDGLGAGEKMEP